MLEKGLIIFLFFTILGIFFDLGIKNKKIENKVFGNLKEQSSYFNQKVEMNLESLEFTSQFLLNEIKDELIRKKQINLDSVLSSQDFEIILKTSFFNNSILSNVIIGLKKSEGNFEVYDFSLDKSEIITKQINYRTLAQNIESNNDGQIFDISKIQNNTLPIFYSTELSGNFTGDFVLDRYIVRNITFDVNSFRHD